MKKIIFSVLIMVLVLVLQSCVEPTSDKKINQQPNPEEVVETKPDAPLLRHIVLFKFKDGASKDSIKIVEDAFRDLPNHISEIIDFEWGLNNSPEELAQGFTHCFFVSFEDEVGRTAYLPHPKHQEFIEILNPTLDKVLVFDYLAKD